jgi:hypothetical protein
MKDKGYKFTKDSLDIFRFEKKSWFQIKR